MKTFLFRFFNGIEKWPVALRLLSGFLLVILLGVIDYRSGYEISFSIFYIIPIGLTVWVVSRPWAFVIAVVSAVVWLLADIGTGHRYSNILIPIWNTVMRMGYFFIIIITLDELRKALKTERQLARTDNLTGVLNSRSFYEILARAVADARKQGTPLSLAYLDLDNFKKVNDSFGHDVGDTLLKRISLIIRGKIRTGDILCRLGGDEFCVLFPGAGSAVVGPILNNIRRIVSLRMKEKRWPVTVSIGAVSCGGPIPDGRKLIIHADKLMYEVKRGGKNGCRMKEICG